MTFETSQPLTSSFFSEPTSISSPPSSDQHGWRQGRFRPPTDGSPASIVINISDGGSTGRGILIGILSAFGSAGIAVLILAIFFFFKYTSRGRILLDRIGRPGEFDDEQAFAHEEAEALETMDELQRAEYLRAKGRRRPSLGTKIKINLTPLQHSFKQIPQSLFRLIFPSRNFSPFRKREFQPGSLNQSWKLRIVLSKPGLRSNFSTRNVAFKATCPSRSRTRCIIGRRKYMTNRKTV